MKCLLSIITFLFPSISGSNSAIIFDSPLICLLLYLILSVRVKCFQCTPVWVCGHVWVLQLDFGAPESISTIGLSYSCRQLWYINCKTLYRWVTGVIMSSIFNDIINIFNFHYTWLLHLRHSVNIHLESHENETFCEPVCPPFSHWTLLLSPSGC